MCLIFHKWTNWTEPFEVFHMAQQITRNYYISAYYETVQKKTCKKCGKVVIRKLSERLV